jgi:hypothetical protein
MESLGTFLRAILPPNQRMRPTLLSRFFVRVFSVLSVSSQVSLHCVSRKAAYARVVRPILKAFQFSQV